MNVSASGYGAPVVGAGLEAAEAAAVVKMSCR
jgi:hypothetical protein